MKKIYKLQGNECHIITDKKSKTDIVLESFNISSDDYIFIMRLIETRIKYGANRKFFNLKKILNDNFIDYDYEVHKEKPKRRNQTLKNKESFAKFIENGLGNDLWN